MFVCIASHKSAEPNTLVVMMDFADRDALVEVRLRAYVRLALGRTGAGSARAAQYDARRAAIRVDPKQSPRDW
jgi:hypothetical protein